MTARWRWGDAAAMRTELSRRPADRRTLLLLARLPLVPVRLLASLAGVHGESSVYRGLRRLADAGLVAAIQPPVHRGHAAGLWYLTDLGLATVALDQGVDVRQLAQTNRLRAADLLARLPGLPHVLTVYDLLATVAAARPGPPDLLAWEQPWRRQVPRPTVKRPVAVSLPAYAAISWDGEAGAYLLLPDRTTCSMRLHLTMLDNLMVLRGLQHGVMPTLVIATSHPARVEAWQILIDDTCQRRAESPVAACIATWADLPAAIRSPPSPAGDGVLPVDRLVQRPRLQMGRPRRLNVPLPRLVGDALSAPTTGIGSDNGVGQIALQLTKTDRILLDLVGRHPFLTTEGLAIALDRPEVWVRRRRSRLISLGLMRILGTDEVDQNTAALEPVELTLAGLAVCAAQQGLSLAVAVRVNGLAGGGPGRPIGARRLLLRHIEHTLGVDGVFVSLIATARRLARAGRDDMLVAWRNGAASSRQRVRPDGYGIYSRMGEFYGFFLEYDRGTMSGRDYRRKFAAYAALLSSGRFADDYDGFPTILVVTTGNSEEERIASAIRAVEVGRVVELPVLLTCRWRIDDPRNPDSLLGPIWREPAAALRARRVWPACTVDSPNVPSDPSHQMVAVRISSRADHAPTRNPSSQRL